VLQFLPVKSLASKLVVKRSALSLEKFLKDHYLSGTPVIISDCMAHWPAKKNWNNIDYLLKVAGDRTVPVEVITLINIFVIIMHGTSSSSLKNKCICIQIKFLNWLRLFSFLNSQRKTDSWLTIFLTDIQILCIKLSS
jgi:hypothetical protein